MNDHITAKLLNVIEEKLSGTRFKHSIGVAETAQMLAVRFKINSGWAYFAGLGHDIARELSNDELMRLATKEAVLEPYGVDFPVVLHGRLADSLVYYYTGYHNDLIAEAMANHTGCAAKMSDLSKIIYIADGFEPNRPYITTEIEQALKTMALDDLFYLSLRESINFLKLNHELIYPETIAQYQLRGGV